MDGPRQKVYARPEKARGRKIKISLKGGWTRMRLALAVAAVAVIIIGHYGQKNARLKESLRICKENYSVFCTNKIEHKKLRIDIISKSKVNCK